MFSGILRLLKRKVIWIPLSIASILMLMIVFTDVDEGESEFEVNTKFPLSDYLFADSKDQNSQSSKGKIQSELEKSIDKTLNEVEKQVQIQANQNYHKDKDGNIVDENGNIVLPKEKIIVLHPNAEVNQSADKNNKTNKNNLTGLNNSRRRTSNAQFDYKSASPTNKERLLQLAKRFESADVNPSDPESKINRDIDYGASSFSNLDKKDEASNEHKLLRTITADRMIPAILITPISSQIGGNKVIAQVESDIYAAMGRAVLIPKGSHAIGFYNSNNKIGEYRLEVVWSRIITPQGVNIILTNAKGADVKGYAGLIGNLHNKYWEKYGLPLTLSTLSNGLLLAISSGLNTQLNKSGGGGVYQSYQTAQLMGQMKDDVSNIVAQILREQVRIKPIITIKEGSRIFISPNVDIFFPEPKDGEVLTEFFKEYKPLPKDDDLSDDENEY
ncbi:hypothetical protein BKH41_01910 [Helicobacter sp. 12S02232-10]|uniref:DNA type IV secretion system protein ComB10 n=1 Tax=Helicobacter sp. 12S02232-10 TaxID=1476197 RepID=UPI000BC8C8EF|nr:DNA type IV secretion system protein ComB10 [Helicobacter sp. 12S02232-10]PAF49444.1 hypothetical protein BKH41_01910 [Helicobacter sp. 12S02232-10]